MPFFVTMGLMQILISIRDEEENEKIKSNADGIA